MQTQPCQPPQTHANSVQLNEANAQWTMTYGGNTYPPPGPYPQISVPRCDNATFTFQIQGNSAGVFNPYPAPPNGIPPVTVAVGNAKPNGNGINSQITNISVSNNGKTLQFSDSNNSQNNLNYVLHFTDGSTLDPIISNGGGCCTVNPGPGPGAFGGNGFVAGLVVGIVLALIGVAIVRFVFRRA
jgi:hypothetical protein